jgi:hypothetical protein
MFVLRNLSSRPTIFRGSMVILSLVGGRLGRMSETVFCILDTAAAHAECFFAEDENFRFAGRRWVASRWIKQRGQMDGAEDGGDTRRALDSRRTRALMLVGGIEEGRCEAQ